MSFHFHVKKIYFQTQNLFSLNSRIFTLKENQMTKKWHSKEVCFGNHLYCNGPKVSGYYAPMILTFGEDELGNVVDFLKQEKPQA